MLAGVELDPPLGDVDVAGVERALQQLFDEIEVDPAPSSTRETRIRPEEALDLGYAPKAAGRVALEGFTDNRGIGIVADEHLAVACHLLVTISRGRGKHPIAVHDAGAHTIDHLLGVLLALVLGDAGEEILDQDAVGIAAELDRRGFQPRTRRHDRAAEFQVGFETARETADVVDEDYEPVPPAMSADERQHRLHGGTIDDRALDALIVKHLEDLVVHASGILPAARLLGVEAVAFPDLPRARYAAVD
ncbi:MAG: hypothetical protein ABJP87_12680 [Bauldia litoralis]